MDSLRRRDLSRVIALTDPEVESHSFFAELGDEGVYRGHDGTRQYMRDLDDAWEIVRADVDDTVGAGDVAVLIGRIHYRGRLSGIETETAAGWMLKFRYGRVVCFRAFREPEQALEALGLAWQARSANLDLVRSMHARWESSDYSSAATWADPEMELVFADGPTPGSWTGIESATSAWRDFLAAWKEWGSEVEEYRELDSERVLALTRHGGRGKTSGLDLGHMRSEGASLYHVREGKVVRNVFYSTASVPLPTSAWRGRGCLNAMKKGLLGGSLQAVTKGADQGGPEHHVARWFGSQPQETGL